MMKQLDQKDFTEQCVISWDEFYSQNYQWALACISGHVDDLSQARKILEKIFMNLTLDNIETINGQDFKSKLSLKLAGVISRINRTERRKKFQILNEKEHCVFY